MPCLAKQPDPCISLCQSLQDANHTLSGPRSWPGQAHECRGEPPPSWGAEAQRATGISSPRARSRERAAGHGLISCRSYPPLLRLQDEPPWKRPTWMGPTPLLKQGTLQQHCVPLTSLQLRHSARGISARPRLPSPKAMQACSAHLVDGDGGVHNHPSDDLSLVGHLRLLILGLGNNGGLGNLCGGGRVPPLWYL